MTNILQPGQRISRYVLVELIGQGGMGAVYKARDEGLGRNVAVKLLPPDLVQDRERRLRFLQEARVAARLNHPHIAAIHEAGEHGGNVFIVMELVEGKTLRSLVRTGPLPISRALDVAAEVAEALAEAHRLQIIHRDLKPDNVMVREDGHAKLLDFGLAKLRDPASAGGAADGNSSLTGEGRVLGTVHYMSPEQARGERVDVRTDVFSFGVLLFEILSGRVPFRGESALDTLSAITRDPTPRVSLLNPEVPPPLERMLDRCLAKDPEERFADAGVLVQELRGLRPRAMSSQAIQVDSLAVLPLRGDAAIEPYLLQGLASELRRRLSPLPDLRVVGPDSSRRSEAVPGDRAEAARRLGVEAMVVGEAERSGERLRVTLHLQEARSGRRLWSDEHERSLEEIPALLDAMAGGVCRALGRRGPEGEAGGGPGASAFEAFLRAVARWPENSAGAWRESVDGLRRVTELAPGFAEAHAALAEAYRTLAAHGGVPGREARLKARAHALQAVEADEHSAAAQAALGGVRLFLDWDGEGATRALTRARELDPGRCGVHVDMGWRLAASGRTGPAVDAMRRALDLEPLSPRAWLSLAMARRLERRPEEMRRTCDQGTERLPDEPSLRYAAGLARLGEGAPEEAAKEIEAALDVARGRPASWLAGLGCARAAAGQADEASRILRELEEASWTRPVSPVCFARVHAALGDAPQALDRLEAACDERSHLLVFLGVDPSWDALRDSPRFGELLRRVGPVCC